MDKDSIVNIELLYDLDIVNIQKVNSILFMTNYVIKTDSGSFFLKQWSSMMDEDDLKQQVAIHNTQKLRVIPSIIQTREGEFKIVLNKKWYSLYNYINSETIVWDDQINDIDFRELGKEISKLHTYLKTIPAYENTIFRNVEVSKKKNEIFEVFNQINPERMYMNEKISRIIDEFEMMPKEGWQILHGDLNRNNLLFDNKRLVGIIDFADCVVGPPVCDLADFCIDICIDTQKRSVQWDIINLILEGYSSKEIDMKLIVAAMIYRICAHVAKFCDNIGFYMRRKTIQSYLKKLNMKIEIILENVDSCIFE